MIYTTFTIDTPRVPLLIGRFHEDGTMDAKTPDGQEWLIERHMVETPVLCCHICGKAVDLRFDKRKKKEYAACPDQDRHIYEAYYVASHDVTKHNRATRNKLAGLARKHLRKWQRTFEARTDIKVTTEMVEPEKVNADPITQS